MLKEDKEWEAVKLGNWREDRQLIASIMICSGFGTV
jgi:hypothetical protein